MDNEAQSINLFLRTYILPLTVTVVQMIKCPSAEIFQLRNLHRCHFCKCSKAIAGKELVYPVGVLHHFIFIIFQL